MESWTRYSEVLLLVAASLFFTVTDPYGATADLSRAWAFFYWLLCLGAGAIVGHVTYCWMAARRLSGGAVVPSVTAILAASLVILGLILTVQYFLRTPVPLSFLATLYLYIILIVVVMAGFLFLLQSHLSKDPETPPADQSVSVTDVVDEGLAAFRGRLPRRLQSATILAVSSDDHYVKVLTHRGDAIIRMRLADAIAHLASLDGQQVHRSWWVARSAVDHVTRDGSGLSLHLTQGQTVPVSRSRRADVDAWLEGRSSAV